MISFAAVIFLIMGFILLIRSFGLVEKSIDVVNISKAAFADVRNPSLNDDAKEQVLQRHAKRLFALFFLLTLGGAAALLVPVGLIWILDQMGVISLRAVMRAALSWQMLLLGTAFGIAALWWGRKI